jgi:hypothetical protein
LTSLRWLDLSNNNIAEISADVFKGLVSLEELHLHANDVRLQGSLDGLSYLTALKTLHIDNIMYIPALPCKCNVVREELKDGSDGILAYTHHIIVVKTSKFAVYDVQFL